MTAEDDPPEEAAAAPTSRSAQDERKAMDTLTDNRAGPEVDADRVKAAMQALRADMEASREAARQREAALSSIKLVDADIAVVMEAADLGRPAAERALQEAGGKLEGALDRLARPEAEGVS